MTQENTLTQHEEDVFPMPDWLIHRLQLAGEYAAFTNNKQPSVSERFRARARETAEIAFTLRKLRSERCRENGVCCHAAKLFRQLHGRRRRAKPQGNDERYRHDCTRYVFRDKRINGSLRSIDDALQHGGTLGSMT